MTTNTTKLGPFLGINTKRLDFELHVSKTGDYLRSADNVDITNTGNVIRRPGETRLQAMGNAHSIQMVTSTTGFLVRGSALYAITLPAYTETLITILTSDAYMSYESLGDDWYYSNGTDIGRVRSGVAYPVGSAPPSAPALVSIGGDLPAGQYQVGVSYVNTITGEEGAFSDLAYLERTTLGGIRVTLPGASTGATHINVYLTECNGTAPMLHSTVVIGTATIDLTTMPTGRIASPRSEDVLPAGTLFYADGRLCSIKGKNVYVGLPFRPGYYLPLSGYIPFPANVSIAIANESGTYIAADKTYFIPGDLGDVQEKIRDVLPCGAVPGTAFRVLHSKAIGWFSLQGFVVVGPDGSIDTSMSDNVEVTAPVIGFSNVTETNGFRKVSGCGYSMNLETKAVTTYSDWAFTSKSDQYGTKTDGIYQTDQAATVSASVGLGKQNFGSEVRKSMPAIYLGVSSSTAMNVQVKAPGMDYTYAARSSSTDLQMQRVDPGKGFKANWFDLTMTNTTGADFTLATVSFAPIATTRRI